MDVNLRDLRSVRNPKVRIKIMQGHFARSHSHVNTYIDISTIKSRCDHAREAARMLTEPYLSSAEVDTIVCLDGMDVVGAYLAEELTKAGVMSRNAHQTIYVVTPEYNSNSQMIFRDNIQPMITGKNVILLMASVTTGKTINKGVECIQYYGGKLQGISAIFSAIGELDGMPVNSVFRERDIPDYQTYDFRECPYCKKGIKLDALVNGYGYSKL